MSDLIELGDVPELTRSAIVQAVYDYLDANLPGGYTPRTGALDDLMINALGQQASELAALLSKVTLGIFRSYGLKVAKVEPIDALPATALTTWTAPDIGGYTIPQGTEISVNGVGFETTSEAVILPGNTSVANVPISATTLGTVGNDLQAPVQVRDNLDWQPTVTVQVPTSGGQDPETDPEYIARLIEELQDLSRTIVTGEDAERQARRVVGVGRVLVLDLYDDDTDTPDQPGHVTLRITDETGDVTDAPTKDRVEVLFANRRLFPLQLHLGDATYHAITVDVTASYWPGWEPATVETQVRDAIAGFLDKLTWGSPQFGGDIGGAWIDDHTISLFALAGAIERVEPIRRVEDLEINGVAADHTMPGIATLPTLDQADVAVTLEVAA